MTSERSIDYDALTQDALRGVVRTILIQVGKTGLPGDHHFYVAFDTQAPGVVLSRRLKEKYPEEMMIVLQHRFWDLLVSDEQFEVKLTFDGIPERLVVPFSALRVFFDPSVRFTLQFGEGGQDDQQETGASRRRRRDNSNGNVEADTPNGPRTLDRSPDRRPKPRTKPRSISSAESEAPQLTEAAPRSGPSLVSRGGEIVVQPAPAQLPAPVPESAQTNGAKSETAASDAATQAVVPGAKVFSLDQFRKK